jgi:hypothetical protein
MRSPTHSKPNIRPALEHAAALKPQIGMQAAGRCSWMTLALRGIDIDHFRFRWAAGWWASRVPIRKTTAVKIKIRDDGVRNPKR